jgi:hypothetical protein
VPNTDLDYPLFAGGVARQSRTFRITRLRFGSCQSHRPKQEVSRYSQGFSLSSLISGNSGWQGFAQKAIGDEIHASPR